MALSFSPQGFAQSHIGEGCVVVVHSFLGQRLIRQWWEEHSSLDSWLQIYFVTKSLSHSTLSYEINPKESIL